MKIFIILSLVLIHGTRSSDLPGSWEVLVQNSRIASMHTVVTRFNTVILLDHLAASNTEHLYPLYHCVPNFEDPEPGPENPEVEPNCFTYSALYDLINPNPRPLTISTDTWCSSGQVLPDGTILQTGGEHAGLQKIRLFAPCETTSFCDWLELEDIQLGEGRWYATNQILPNGSVIIIGGRNSTSLELLPPQTGASVVDFPFLADAADDQPDTLYPYVHLLPNGHLFVFANNKSILYDHASNIVLKEYPVLEGGPRNYPSAGSSAMLPLTGDFSSATILVCGGATYGAFKYQDVNAPATSNCGRIDPTKEDAEWELEEMPVPRIMGDMVILPTGEILIINGAQSGSQGFGLARKPVLNPVLYKPDEPVGARFSMLQPGTVPRMYHATANLLPDGRVLLAGSNPHEFYNFTDDFPTELKIEAFSPPYLSPEYISMRLTITDLPENISYGDIFYVSVTAGGLMPNLDMLQVNLINAPFATHSFSQGQRMVKLETSASWSGTNGSIACRAPPDGRVAPPGHYMLFVVYQGIPSVARWARFGAVVSG